MDTEQFRALLARYNNNTATDQERAWVEQWYEKLHGADLIPEETNLKNQLYSRVKEQISIDQPAPVQVSKFRKLYPWIAAAAILCVLFNIGLLYFNKATGSNTPQSAEMVHAAANHTIAPGSNKAILTLADGSKISLSDAGKGKLADQAGVVVTKAANGGLIYKITGDSHTAAKYNTISTPRGGQYQLLLADGTKIWLNANSSLTFPTAFPGDSRRVSLQGEAYFEVAKDKSKAFFVKTGQTEIRVLGTHFNIMAYEDENYQHTTLLEGSVEISKGIEKSLLKPGQQARTAASSSLIRIRDIENPEGVIAWKNGYFQFEKSDLHSLMRQISRWYATDVLYQGEIPRKEYSGKIPRTVNVKTLIEMLSYSGIHCRVENNKIIVSER
ncbi:ferric-dicitrate binding protein FerR (iron transport regulator) [Pedobacter cryoconitis]|uniref:FecR family protein n=1 Tax=Pedobacter cryoconitis TaxID=188932 RepID=UPI00160D6247|nr:FecR family protein [Pedobacter cryoconitis]MBB6270273.1 ferric-dicitrate binding protein FerR (iron transport regulator) [Pedobacter cryoconitis]